MRALIVISLIFMSSIVFANAQEYGIASVYSATFQGKRTASGEFFNHNGFTAAHQKYPFGTLIKVTRIDNGKWVIVRINDRGPFVSQRITDLSKAAALKLGFAHEKEEVKVKIELVQNQGNEIGASNKDVPQKSLPLSNEQPLRSTSSSQKADIAPKIVDERSILKEYRYARNGGIQKKNTSL